MDAVVWNVMNGIFGSQPEPLWKGSKNTRDLNPHMTTNLKQATTHQS